MLSRITVISVVIACVLGCPKFSSADTISLLADEWPPFSAEPKDEKPGYIIEIARTIFEKSGHRVDHKISPWSRAVKDTRNGVYNAIVGAAYEDAPGFIFPDESVGIVQGAFFTLPESTWEFSGIDSLSQMTIGIIADYSYGTELDNYILRYGKDAKRVQIVKSENATELNIKKLQAGRVDAVVDYPEVFFSTAEKMHLSKEKFRQAGRAKERQPIYIAFSPSGNLVDKSKNYAEILSKGIVEMRQDGRLASILKKYGVQDWK